jgi:hypothetical protein
MPISDVIMVSGLFVFAFFMLKVLFETRRFLKYLEENHPGEFAKLGFPHWKIQWGDPSLRLAMKYIRKRQFAPLGDENLETSYKAIRVYERFGWLAGGIAVLATIAGPYFR